jgi:hypothetical protein
MKKCGRQACISNPRYRRRFVLVETRFCSVGQDVVIDCASACSFLVKTVSRTIMYVEAKSQHFLFKDSF